MHIVPHISRFLLLASLCLLSCKETSTNLPNVLAGTSEHFNYYVREEDDSFCEDLLATMEQHFATIQGYLGFRWPSGQKINYYKFIDLEDYQNSTGLDYWADTQNSSGTPSVLSPELFHQHELIHAYLFATGLPVPLLTEGIAETFSQGGNCLFGGVPPDVTFEEAFNNNDMLYYNGCRWAGHLLNTWNTETILKLYASLPYDASIEETNKRFEDELGVSAEETWQMLVANNDAGRRIIPIWHCTAPEVAVDGTEQLIRADCDTPYYQRTFVLEEDSLVSANQDIPASWIYRCDSSPLPIDVQPTFSTQGNLYLLSAGKYVIEPQWSQLPNTINEAPTMIFSGEPIVADWIGRSCSAISEPAPYENGFALSLPANSGVTYISVNIPGQSDPYEPSSLTDEDISLNESNGGVGISVGLCPNCEQDTSQCLPLSFGSTETVSPGEYFLRVQIEETLPKYYRLSLLIR